MQTGLNIQRRVDNKQLAQKINHDTSTPTITFVTNDPVHIESFTNTRQIRLQGHIIQPVGQSSYLVKLTDGHIFQRHVDHLQKSFITNTIPDTVPQDYYDVVFPDQVTQNNNGTRRYYQRQTPSREVQTLKYELDFFAYTCNI